MNPSAVLGMTGGAVPPAVAVMFTVKDAVVFLNLPGPVIVAGGTLATPRRPEASDVGP